MTRDENEQTWDELSTYERKALLDILLHSERNLQAPRAPYWWCQASMSRLMQRGFVEVHPGFASYKRPAYRITPRGVSVALYGRVAHATG